MKKITILLTILFLSCFVWLSGFSTPALANLNDDRYDGNIYVVYAGNGSLVPTKINFQQSLAQAKPIILVYYLDDSSDCKQYAIVVSRIQEFYGRAANILPINVDKIPVKDSYTPEETGYYYQGLVPQTVILDQEGKQVFSDIGQTPYEKIDDALREVFDLLPRSESLELKRRSFNQFNTELTN